MKMGSMSCIPCETWKSRLKVRFVIRRAVPRYSCSTFHTGALPSEW